MRSCGRASQERPKCWFERTSRGFAWKLRSCKTKKYKDSRNTSHEKIKGLGGAGDDRT